MKRPILALLAALSLSVGVFGTAPARAATPDSMTQAVPTPAHDHGHRHDHRERDGHEDGHRHHPRDGYRHGDGDGHDDGHDGRHGRCGGLIVICLL